MKVLTKIALFVLVVALGIVLINNSLSASMQGCTCVFGINVEEECNEFCSEAHSECLYMYLSETGCQFGDCLAFWYMECDSRAKDYLITQEECPECEW